MTDREKVIKENVIKGLECCTAELGTYQHRDDFCAVCPYKDKDPKMSYCFHKVDLMRDALALLKAQEPRVMTLEEAAGAEVCWIEVRSRRGVEPGNVRLYREDDYSAFINRLLPYVNENLPQHEYGEHWRCWTSRPTDEQRRAIPWQ